MLLLLVCADSASAQVSVSWNGSNGAWLTAGNWTPGVVPSNTVNTTYSVNIINGPSAVDLTNPNFNQLFTVRVDTLTLAQGNALKIVNTTFSLGSGVSSNASALQLSFLSTFQNLGGSTLNNSGFLGNIDFSSIMQNYGNLNNSGTLESDASLENFAGANITNTGFLLNNVGVLQNDANATIDNFGTIQNNQAAGGAYIENYGTINLFSGPIKNFGVIDNFGTINSCQQCASSAVANGSGATFNNGGSIALGGSFANSGAFNNSALDAASGLTSNGTFSILNGGSFSNGGPSPAGGGSLPGYFTNPGTLNINSGAMFTNGPGSTLDSSGSILVAGAFNNDPGAMVTLNPQPLPPGGIGLPAVQIDAGGVFNNAGSMVSTRPPPAGVPAVQINTGGTFNNMAGGTLDSSGQILVAGTFNNDPGAMVTLNPQPLPPGGIGLPAVQIDAGGVFNNNGSITWSRPPPQNVPAVQINFGGTLMGNGAVNGDVMNGGNISPGNSPGIMTINGNYIQTSGGAYTAELGGIFAGQYDQLNISGNASLAGTLNVSLFNNFVVNLGNSFIILNANSITGTFDILHLPTIGPGMYWLLNYSPTNVTLNVAPVPEPGTLLLVATGLAGAFFRRRSRRA